MLKTVAIYSKENKPKTNDGVIRLIKEFGRRGINMKIYQKNADLVSYPDGELIEKFNDLNNLKMPDLDLRRADCKNNVK
jgi:hypothetical protein